MPPEIREATSAALRGTGPGTATVRSLADAAAGASMARLRSLLGKGDPGQGARGRENLLAALASPEAAAARLASLPDAGIRGLVERAVRDFGGLVPASRFELAAPEGMTWNPEGLRGVLEAHLLGTCERISLEALGVSLMGEALVVFSEVVRGLLLEAPFDPGPLDRIAASGIDLLSDLSHLLGALREDHVRATGEGRPYRTFSRRFQGAMIWRPEGFLSRVDAVELLASLARDLRFLGIRRDGRIVPTEAAGRFDGRPVPEKLRRLLPAVLRIARRRGSPLHGARLQGRLLETLALLRPGRWRDPMAAPFVARNRYLSDLVAEAAREGGGSPPRTPIPSLEPGAASDPARMAWSLYEFQRRLLFPLGLVDLGFRGERIVAVRLTPLGARVLGAGRPARSPAGRHPPPLVVNPDFEILAYPEGRTEEMVHRLDRMASRVKSERILHFRITRESVRRAVAGGFAPEAILETLARRARAPVPDNVAFAVRDWGSRVRFVTLVGGGRLVARDPETIERVLGCRSLRGSVAQRAGAAEIRLRGEVDPAAVTRELAAEGIYVR